jgi:hypothetical protein
MDLAQLAKDIADAYTPPDTGRPAGIGDPHIVQELLAYIEAGNYGEVAAELAGISDNTYRNWIKRGEDGEPPFTLFLRAVKRAAAKAEAVEVGKVRNAGNDPRFWAASMTYLERKYPDKWARRSEPNDNTKITINIGLQGNLGPTKVIQVDLPQTASQPLLTEGAE